MSTTSTRTRRRAAVAAAAIVLLNLAMFIPAGSALAAKKLTISPPSDLGNGQFVHVSWNGYGNGQLLYFRQCADKASDVTTQCTKLLPFTGQSSGVGAGDTYQPVQLGDVISVTGADTEDTSDDVTFKCDYSHPCAMVAFTDEPNADDLGSATRGKIEFGKTPDSCPTPTGASVSGSGSAEANLAMFRWEVEVCDKPHNLSVEYTTTNSPSGRSDFTQGLSDFAMTGTPFTPDELKDLGKQTFGYAPTSTGSLVLAYKIFQTPGGNLGPQVTDLKLTPKLVAQIFTGQILNWRTNPGINNLNPKYEGRLPVGVRPVFRADQSAATYQFTSWLSENAGQTLGKSWKKACKCSGATEVFPTLYAQPTGTGFGILGEDNLAHYIVLPDDADFTQFGYIGYMDQSTADYYGLPTVKIQNAKGKFVSATPNAVQAGLKHLKKGKDGFATPDYTTKDPKAYPIPTVTYSIVPTNKIDPLAGGVMKTFLDWATTDGQKGTALAKGYVPLPANLAAQAKTVIDQIPGHAKNPTDPTNPKSPTGPAGPTTNPTGPTDYPTTDTPGTTYPTGTATTGDTQCPTPASSTAGAVTTTTTEPTVPPTTTDTGTPATGTSDTPTTDTSTTPTDTPTTDTRGAKEKAATKPTDTPSITPTTTTTATTTPDPATTTYPTTDTSTTVPTTVPTTTPTRAPWRRVRSSRRIRARPRLRLPARTTRPVRLATSFLRSPRSE